MGATSTKYHKHKLQSTEILQQVKPKGTKVRTNPSPPPADREHLLCVEHLTWLRAAADHGSRAADMISF